eukprot:m.89559 g.89559  ORF g.89559 m.89559 type:complete len:75 (-) comp20067_c0_seq1:1962-2186(-)
MWCIASVVHESNIVASPAEIVGQMKHPWSLNRPSEDQKMANPAETTTACDPVLAPKPEHAGPFTVSTCVENVEN